MWPAQREPDGGPEREGEGLPCVERVVPGVVDRRVRYLRPPLQRTLLYLTYSSESNQTVFNLLD